MRVLVLVLNRAAHSIPLWTLYFYRLKIQSKCVSIFAVRLFFFIYQFCHTASSVFFPHVLIFNVLYVWQFEHTPQMFAHLQMWPIEFIRKSQVTKQRKKNTPITKEKKKIKVQNDFEKSIRSSGATCCFHNFYLCLNANKRTFL